MLFVLCKKHALELIHDKQLRNQISLLTSKISISTSVALILLSVFFFTCNCIFFLLQCSGEKDSISMCCVKKFEFREENEFFPHTFVFNYIMIRGEKKLLTSIYCVMSIFDSSANTHTHKPLTHRKAFILARHFRSLEKSVLPKLKAEKALLDIYVDMQAKIFKA